MRPVSSWCEPNWQQTFHLLASGNGPWQLGYICPLPFWPARIVHWKDGCYLKHHRFINQVEGSNCQAELGRFLQWNYGECHLERVYWTQSWSIESRYLELSVTGWLQEHTANHKGPDYDALHANFGWAPTKIIKATFLKMTQFCHHVIQPNSMHQHFKSQFLTANIHNRNELVATQVATTRT